jgi:hypothetical protein
MYTLCYQRAVPITRKHDELPWGADRNGPPRGHADRLEHADVVGSLPELQRNRVQHAQPRGHRDQDRQHGDQRAKHDEDVPMPLKLMTWQEWPNAADTWWTWACGLGSKVAGCD